MTTSTLWVLAMMVASISAFRLLPGDRRRPPYVVSKRDDAVTVDSVVDRIASTLEEASGSISAEDLAEAVSNVHDDVQTLLGGQEVNETAVGELIDETASTINSVTAISALFDDPLSFQGNNLATALALWDKLAMKARSLEEAGETVTTALAAIEKTSESIATVIRNSVAIAQYQYGDESDGDDSDGDDSDGEADGDDSGKVGEKVKRQWRVGANYNRNGGLTGGLTYQRGGFRAGVHGSWNPRTGGRSYGVGFSYTFGK